VIILGENVVEEDRVTVRSSTIEVVMADLVNQ
jgi:hypothetical protein